jgi:hypothetical protein
LQISVTQEPKDNFTVFPVETKAKTPHKGLRIRDCGYEPSLRIPMPTGYKANSSQDRIQTNSRNRDNFRWYFPILSSAMRGFIAGGIDLSIRNDDF